MTKTLRQVIKIDEELCDGCGACVPACAEAAIQVIDGKARLVSDKYCDGLGACLGECPQGAISFETREAEEFDEEATREHLSELGRPVAGHSQEEHRGHIHADGTVCPSARTIDRTHERAEEEQPAAGDIPSELRQWPVKLYLVNPTAPYFQNADLLIAADCTPFVYGGFHPDFLRGKTIVTGCPKLDDTDLYARKLTDIIAQNDIRSVTVVQMEVPCCSGIAAVAKHAVEQSGKDVPVEVITISLEGEVV